MSDGEEFAISRQHLATLLGSIATQIKKLKEGDCSNGVVWQLSIDTNLYYELCRLATLSGTAKTQFIDIFLQNALANGLNVFFEQNISSAFSNNLGELKSLLNEVGENIRETYKVLNINTTVQ